MIRKYWFVIIYLSVIFPLFLWSKLEAQLADCQAYSDSNCQVATTNYQQITLQGCCQDVVLYFPYYVWTEDGVCRQTPSDLNDCPTSLEKSHKKPE